MTTPTPTPDTLRAAIERLRDELQSVVEQWRGLPPMAVHGYLRGLHAGAGTLAEGLIGTVDAALAASPAPTDTPDEPCADCGHPREDHSQGDPPDYSCWHVYVWALGGCDCGSFRPAAVTAPHEDEHVNHGPGEWWYACPACPHAALAAAPAVERATPDPDTLAELLRATYPEHDHDTWHDTWHAMAHALIAAGVTLTTPPTPGQGHTAP